MPAESGVRAPAPEPPGYERRRPEETDLHRILSAWLPPFLERAETAGGLPAFVVDALESYLECGVLEHGFARIRCPVCQDDLLVGFSCGGRGLCPSCCGRRMADCAAHLVDRVIPRVPVRQWVLTLPFALRPMLAFDAQLASEVGARFVQTVGAFYEAEARRHGRHADTPVRFGAVTAQQRAGSALNLNLHYHSLLLDGVYHRRNPDGPVVFRAQPELTDDQVRGVLHTFRHALAKLLNHRGLADEPSGDSDHDMPPSAMEQLTFLAVRTPTGTSDRPRRDPSSRSKPLCISEDGFTLHANTRVARHRRTELEVLCKYITRPAVSIDQVRWRDDGLVGWRLKRPWSDGTTELCFEPLSFLGRLATLIPAPYSNQLVYHGVLAPAAKWRPEVVSDAARASHRSRRAEAPSPCAELPVSDDPDQPRPRKLSWAQLMWRSLGLDVLTCARCGNPRQVVALIRDPGSIRDILGHLGLLGQKKGPSAPRGPPQLHLDLP